MRPGRILLFFFMIILAVLLIGPLLIPIPPLEDTRLPRELADPDSLFIEVNGIEIHYKRMGQGEPFILLLHGFGASVYSWREVMAPLSQYGTVIAYDRPAFGLSARPLPGEWSGANPYSMDSQVDLVFSLMDALGIQQAILAGHSAGGVLAVAAALHDPQRVTGLILVDAAVYASGGPPGWIRPLLNAPQFDRLGPWFVRSLAGEQGTAFLQAAWHDPGKISADVMEGYRKPLQVENWDIALWEFTKANRGRDYSAQLVDVHQPALVITGDDDRIVPSEESNRLANDLPNADLVIISACGHLPQEEKPGEFMVAVVKYLQANQWIK